MDSCDLIILDQFKLQWVSLCRTQPAAQCVKQTRLQKFLEWWRSATMKLNTVVCRQRHCSEIMAEVWNTDSLQPWRFLTAKSCLFHVYMVQTKAGLEVESPTRCPWAPGRPPCPSSSQRPHESPPAGLFCKQHNSLSCVSNSTLSDLKLLIITENSVIWYWTKQHKNKRQT